MRRPAKAPPPIPKPPLQCGRRPGYGDAAGSADPAAPQPASRYMEYSGAGVFRRLPGGSAGQHRRCPGAAVFGKRAEKRPPLPAGTKTGGGILAGQEGGGVRKREAAGVAAEKAPEHSLLRRALLDAAVADIASKAHLALVLQVAKQMHPATL